MEAPAPPQPRLAASASGARRTAYRVPLTGRQLCAGALASVALFVLVFLVEVCTQAGQRQDAVVFARFQAVPFGDLAGPVRDGVPMLLGAVTVVLGVRALMRRTVRPVLAQAVVVVLAAVGSELLKEHLPRPYHGTFAYVENTFPSSHMATTTALACAVLALWGTGRWRAEGAFVVLLLTFVAGIYNVTGFAHRPSDVVGGVLVALALEGFVLAALGLGVRRPRAVPPPDHTG